MISYHISWYHMISYHMIWYHIIWYHIIRYHIIWYHIIWYHIIWYHMISYDMISYDMIYRVCRPQVLQRNGQFHFFLQIFARMPARSRENLQEKMKLTISLPQGPLKEPFIYIINSKFIHFLLFICFIYIFNQNSFILLIYWLKID